MTTTTTGIACTLGTLCFLLTVQLAWPQGTHDSVATSQREYSLDSSSAHLNPITSLGSIDPSPTQIVPDSLREFSDYGYAGGLLSMVPGQYTFDLASPGQLHGITIDGLDQRAIGFMSDGAPLNEPMTGTYNLYFYPAEQLERIEIISGTSAFYYGLNSNAGAINFVSKSRKAIHPYTRLRFTHSAYGNELVDASFSQDIIRGMNLSLGVFHQTNTGRYPNSNYEDWNGRAKIRYNINNKVDVFISGNYNSTNLGLNGGVDINKTPQQYWYNQLSEFLVMVNTDSYEKVHRYDLQVGAAATLFPDTTAVTTFTAYHSTNFREYRDEENRLTPNGRYVAEDTRSQWYGMKLNQHFEISTASIDLGVQMERRGVIASDLFGQSIRNLSSVFGKFDLYQTDYLRTKLLGRVDNYLGKTHGSYGIEVSSDLLDHFRVIGGYSDSYRYPTVQEQHLPDTLTAILSYGNGLIEEHKLFEFGIAVSNLPDFFMKLTYTNRSIDAYNIFIPDSIYSLTVGDEHPITYPQKHISGFTLLANLRIGSIWLEASTNCLMSERSYQYDVIPPKWSATGGIYFWDKLFGGHLDMKTGIQGRANSSTPSVSYNPQTEVYYGDSAPEIAGSGTIDFVLIGHIGSAYVHFIWENLLDSQYYTTTLYPMNERIIRFGVSWEFTD